MKEKLITREIDELIDTAVFGQPEAAEDSRRRIRTWAIESGIVPASIQGLYEASGRGLYHNITVPAINIRGITYEVARSVFRAALRQKVGAFIFEIARSEIGYTAQNPAEYATCVLAAAIKEQFRGPVFIQGDHFQVSRARYTTDPQKELQAIKDLIQSAVAAWFFNIDIDASTLVDLSKANLEEQQENNYRVTAEMTGHIRALQPAGVVISVGGEIGEVGRQNSTVQDLRAFMAGYVRELGGEVRGLSKISVQTGTSHGGVVLPDGTMATVKLDFKTLEQLSKTAREEFGLAGAVQHGASTLPDEAFDMFPKAGATEVHLATGFQNIIYDHPSFPPELRERVIKHLFEKHSPERKSGETDAQFIYENRKRAFGPFKKEMWHLPASVMQPIQHTLEERFALIFRKLNVTNTLELVNRFVKPTIP